MNNEQLDNLESFDKKQLEIIATGIIEKSNLEEFQADAKKFIASIKTKLETDEDFSEAKLNVATCKTVELRIANSWDGLINQIPAFANAKKVIFGLKEQISEARITIDKLVTSEEARKKREITQGAKDRLNGLIINSPVKHGFQPNTMAIDAAIKGKRLYSKMQEAVNAVVEAEELRLANLESDYAKNIAAIEAAEKDWPITFHDKRTVALGAPEMVEATIQARIADHRLKVAEKARKEKEEAERAAAEKLRKEQEQATLPGPQVDFPSLPTGQIAETLPNPFIDLPLPPPINTDRRYRITVTAKCTAEWSERLVDIIRGLGGVDGVEVEELR